MTLEETKEPTVEEALKQLREMFGSYPQIIVDIRDCGNETRGQHGRIEYGAQIGMNGKSVLPTAGAVQVKDLARFVVHEKRQRLERVTTAAPLLHKALTKIFFDNEAACGCECDVDTCCARVGEPCAKCDAYAALILVESPYAKGR